MLSSRSERGGVNISCSDCRWEGCCARTSPVGALWWGDDYSSTDCFFKKSNGFYSLQKSPTTPEKVTRLVSCCFLDKRLKQRTEYLRSWQRWSYTDYWDHLYTIYCNKKRKSPQIGLVSKLQNTLNKTWHTIDRKHIKMMLCANLISDVSYTLNSAILNVVSTSAVPLQHCRCC